MKGYAEINTKPMRELDKSSFRMMEFASEFFVFSTYENIHGQHHTVMCPGFVSPFMLNDQVFHVINGIIRRQNKGEIVVTGDILIGKSMGITASVIDDLCTKNSSKDGHIVAEGIRITKALDYVKTIVDDSTSLFARQYFQPMESDIYFTIEECKVIIKLMNNKLVLKQETHSITDINIAIPSCDVE